MKIDETRTYIAASGGNYLSESPNSGVFWSAILAGAFAAVAITVVLVMLGSAMGFTFISPWNSAEQNIGKITFAAVAWLIVTQWLSAALGGYITGRLRTKWTQMPTGESFFRDTAHGLITWAIATLFIICASTTATGFITRTAAEVNSAQHQKAADDMRPMAYYSDQLFRSNDARVMPANMDTREEADRLLARASMTPEDRAQLVSLISRNTGISLNDAQARVDTVMVQMKTDADAARKIAAKVSLFGALALLIGALIASAAAALGGIHRDEWEAHPLGYDTATVKTTIVK